MDQDQYWATAGDWILGGRVVSRASADRNALKVYRGESLAGEHCGHGARGVVFALYMGGDSSRTRT